MLTLAAPVLLLAIVCVYSVIRTFVNALEARRRHPPDSEVSWWDSFKAREHQVAKKAVAKQQKKRPLTMDEIGVDAPGPPTPPAAKKAKSGARCARADKLAQIRGLHIRPIAYF